MKLREAASSYNIPFAAGRLSSSSKPLLVIITGLIVSDFEQRYCERISYVQYVIPTVLDVQYLPDSRLHKNGELTRLCELGITNRSLRSQIPFPGLLF